MQTATDTYFKYFPVSPRDEDWGIYVTTAGYVKIPPGAAYPPPGHPKGYAFSWENGRILHDFSLHYIPQGSGIFESKSGVREKIGAGSVFILFPNEWHRYAAHASTGWHEYWVGFRGPYAKRLLQKGFLSPKRPVLQLREEHALLDLFTDIISEMRAERTGFSHILGATTTHMLALVHAASRTRNQVDTYAETMIRKAKTLLHERIDRPVDLDQVAGELRVSVAWLRRNFGHHTGLPLHQYHLQLRINRAMHLLSGTNIPVKEVATHVGFEDSHYFSRVFKKKAGSSPEAWRQLYQTSRKPRPMNDG